MKQINNTFVIGTIIPKQECFRKTKGGFIYAKKKNNTGVSVADSFPQVAAKKTILSGDAIRRKQVREEDIRRIITEQGI